MGWRTPPTHLSHSNRTQTMQIKRTARPITPSTTHRPFLTGTSAWEKINKQHNRSQTLVSTSVREGYSLMCALQPMWCGSLQIQSYSEGVVIAVCVQPMRCRSSLAESLGPHETAVVQSLQYSDRLQRSAYRLLTRNKYAFSSDTLDKV